MLKNTYIFQALTHILQSGKASLDTAAKGCYTCHKNKTYFGGIKI